MNGLRVSASVLKFLLGIMFLISALSKFITIDTFEIYVYSFGLFPLAFCFVVARLVISLELILGAALISHRHHRLTTLTALLFIVCFIVFLTYAHLVGRTDNCHCFGELMAFGPVQSIMKNAMIVLALLFVFKFAPDEWYPKWRLVLSVYLLTACLLLLYMLYSLHTLEVYSLVLLLVVASIGVLASFPFYSRWYVALPLILTPLVTVFIQSPPDNWFYQDLGERYDEALFLKEIGTGEAFSNDTLSSDAEVLQSPLSRMGLDEGKHLVAFFSPGCGYCKLAAEKLSTIVRREEIDQECVVYVFPQVRDTSRYAVFYEDTRSLQFPYAVVDKRLFLDITRGSFPLLLLVHDGRVERSFSYRNIDEETIGDFISAQ